MNGKKLVLYVNFIINLKIKKLDEGRNRSGVKIMVQVLNLEGPHEQ